MKRQTKLQPIDRVAVTLIVLLSLVIAVLIGGRTLCQQNNCPFQTGPRVKNFNWQDRQIGSEDTAFILTFTRPMDTETVEKNLQINPPLAGKFSWSGRRMAYTLLEPAPYGNPYQVELQNAQERFTPDGSQGELIRPFLGSFQTRDRRFAYIGVEGEEQGRLILYNLTQQRQEILTPPDLVVSNFYPYPDGDRILFSATSQLETENNTLEDKLYTVTTGLNFGTSEEVNPKGKIDLIVDNKKYRNLRFQLSEDGETIVIQRINREDPKDFGLWVKQNETEAQSLDIVGGEFFIAPDSQTLAVAQGEGITLRSLEPGEEPLGFFPQFGQVLDFSRDGISAAMINFNTQDTELRYQRSLILVTNFGEQKKLLDTQGSILSCEFTPKATQLYCLLTNLIRKPEYREQPYLAVIDLETTQEIPLLILPDYQDIQMSLAPDGLGILFDQVKTTRNPTEGETLKTNSGEIIATSHLWLVLPPSPDSPETKPQLEELPIAGYRPRWLP